VGENYKTPFLPIWVICKEYHYSVIFSNTISDVNTQEAEKREVILIKKFCLKFYSLHILITFFFFLFLKKNEFKVNLIYYDGLNHPEDFIVLSLFKSAKIEKQKFPNGIVPSMNQLLTTKWGEDLVVEWIGIEPIL
jgi:ubiquitin carboxyl-terminal hydrolase MINDY-3/4